MRNCLQGPVVLQSRMVLRHRGIDRRVPHQKRSGQVWQCFGAARPPSTERFYETPRNSFIFCEQHLSTPGPPHSTVTDLARFLGLSISVPRANAA